MKFHLETGDDTSLLAASDTPWTFMHLLHPGSQVKLAEIHSLDRLRFRGSWRGELMISALSLIPHSDPWTQIHQNTCYRVLSEQLYAGA